MGNEFEKLRDLEKIIILNDSSKYPAKINYKIGIRKKITCISMDKISFWEVLERRRSNRGGGAVTIERLSQLLHCSARVQSSNLAEDGSIKTKRPYAGAGGRHSIEILCLANNVIGLNPGIWHFNPFISELGQIEINNKFIEELNVEVKKLLNVEENPPLVLVYLSDVKKLTSRYQNGISLLFKDAGNLSATISLACEALGLNSCQLGLNSEFNFYQDIGVCKDRMWIVGAHSVFNNKK